MKIQTGLFICPSCQGVVRSDRSLEEGVSCEECGHQFDKPSEFERSEHAREDPYPQRASSAGSGSVVRDLTRKKLPTATTGLVVERTAIPAKTLDEAMLEAVSETEDSEEVMEDGSLRVKRRKKRPKKARNKGLILFLTGWISVVLIIFALFKMGQGDSKSADEDLAEEVISEQTVKNEVLKRFYPQVTGNFVKFITYPSNEGREQFISDAADLSLSFSRHYQRNTFPAPESRMQVTAKNVIKLADRDFGIETIWEDKDGRKIGALHLWDGEDWKLDWENFARYSTMSWSRFRAEIGPKKGNFRLLVRKRETSDESEKFYLSFYRAPEFYEDGEEFRATESPEVELEVESILGHEFLKLWADYKAGKVPYQSILSEELDPPNCLRLNVVLAWEKDARGESVMVLKEIVGVSWFGRAIQKYQQADLEEKAEATDLSINE